jgi:adenylate kinase
MKLVLIGIQGSGKSTQGNLLSKRLNIPYLSTGHIFREIAKEKTQLGRFVKELVNAGALIPDNKTIEIVNTYLSRNEYKNGYILDGFPRTIKQAEKFVNHVDKVIFLDVPEKEALWRIAFRKDAERADETLPAIKKRISLFYKLTTPVIEYYDKKGKLISVDGMESIEKVNKDILRGLGKQLIKNQVQAWERKKKVIIAITGMPGSGKSEASDYLAQKKLPVVSFSDLLNDYIDKEGLDHTEANHKKFREEWRAKYGPAAFAILNEKKVGAALEKSPMIVIQGMRSWEEYTYLKKKFPKAKIYILAIYADKHKRYLRIAKRNYRRGLSGEQRDINELIGTNMGPTIASADFMIKNNFSLEDYYDKLEEVYRDIYFS